MDEKKVKEITKRLLMDEPNTPIASILTDSERKAYRAGIKDMAIAVMEEVKKIQPQS